LCGEVGEHIGRAGRFGSGFEGGWIVDFVAGDAGDDFLGLFEERIANDDAVGWLEWFGSASC